MTPLTFKAILFDVDDTLFDRELAFTSWVKRYASTQLLGSSAVDANNLLLTAKQIQGDGYGSKKELLEKLLMIYPPSSTASYSATLAYEEFVSFTKLDASATLLLDFLDSVGFPYGIVTNGGERQARKVNLLRLPERTNCVFISGTFGCAKPDHKIFHAAAKCLGYAPADILMVGDHPVNDIAGAFYAGMRTAWLPNGKTWPVEMASVEPDIVLQNTASLKEIAALQSVLNREFAANQSPNL